MLVYAITNLLNGKKYVGQTTRTLEKRFKEHIRDFVSGIGREIRKYGVENFKLEILEKCKNIDELNECEIFWIKKLNSRFPNGYNKKPGGGDFVRSFFRVAKSLRQSPLKSKKFERIKELQSEIENLKNLLLISQSQLIKVQSDLNETQKLLSVSEQKLLSSESKSKDVQADLKVAQAMLDMTKKQDNEKIDELRSQLAKTKQKIDKLKKRNLLDRIFNKTD